MKTSDGTIRVRFAPSPTGLFHVGSARVALFNYLFARQKNGVFVLRIEDTDRERSKPEYENDILSGMKWLGLGYDEIYKQSERTGIYKKYLEKLIAEDKAYVSKEEPKEPGERSEVIRFRNPNKKVKFHDLIRGDIEFDTTELGDFVIAKSLDEPIFHFVVVADDFDMGITHIIRGEDHISNTPRHILIQEAIGAPQPIYAHLPLILDEKRAKLSKRVHGEKTSVDYYEKAGYLPAAFLNFLAMLGWNPGGDEEIMPLAEMTEKFDIAKVQKGGAIFNAEKLLWFNKEYLKRLSPETALAEIRKRLPERFRDSPLLGRIAPIIIERIAVWHDLETMVETGELDYFFVQPEPPTDALVWKKGGTAKDAKENLEAVGKILGEISEKDFSADTLSKALMPLAEEKGKGNVLWPLRVALSGLERSPDPFTLLAVFGKTESLARLRRAEHILS